MNAHARIAGRSAAAGTAGSPIVPRPICWCRSSFDPRRAFASFMCHTFTAPVPIVLRSRQRSAHSQLAHEVIARHMAMARVETRPHRHDRLQLFDEFRHLLEIAAQRELRPRRVLDQHAKIAVVEPHALGCRPCNRLRRQAQPLTPRQPFHDPGCSTRYSAPSASARSTSPRKAATLDSRNNSSGCTDSPGSWRGSPAARSRIPSAASASARSGSPPAVAPATSAGSTRKSERCSPRSRAPVPPPETPHLRLKDGSQSVAPPQRLPLFSNRCPKIQKRYARRGEIAGIPRNQGQIEMQSCCCKQSIDT